MTQLIQNLVDGLGQGSIYALLALGLALIFGVMHLVNFAHGELITVSAYASYALASRGAGWGLLAVAVIATSVLTAVAIEFLAFRWVRGADEFTMLLTSFGVHFVVAAFFVMYVSPRPLNIPKPGWIFDTVTLGGVTLEVADLATIVITLATLAATTWLLRRTLFGIALRASAEDFDAARIMGVRSNRVIRGAFALSGVLAGVASVFWLMRTGTAAPEAGLTPLLFGVIAAIVGGLGSLGGAVLGGLALGVAQVLLRAWLPSDLSGLTEGLIFVLIALLFIVRPQGFVTVRRAERV
ncbi:MAG TPA: branched-chain amino acid ABC transporter permease [Actinomycetota bacterium]|nr:branched-chain amino acid ABC transporter permease [Actinomycetota bacterium]